jgi:hypothetical protein
MLEPRMIMTRSTRQAQAVAAILPTMPGFRSVAESVELSGLCPAHAGR